MRSIDLIVIHCSATPNGVWISPEQIDAWHAKRGFRRDPADIVQARPSLPHIGYHGLILADGTHQPCRALEEVGAHVKGHNKTSIGICMIGMDAYFQSQWHRLREVLCTIAFGFQDRAGRYEPYPVAANRAIEIFAAHGVSIYGHRDLSPDADGNGTVEPTEWIKTCPGFDVASWLARMMQPEPGRVLDEHPSIAMEKGSDRRIFMRRAA